MIPLAFGLFGLIVGSFLNVVILRYGVRTIGGRSTCMSCGQRLRWFDMVPIVSWLALRGRCRHCKTWISIQYPIVEFTTGALFAIAAYPGSVGFTYVYPGILGNLGAFPILMLPSLGIISLLIAIAAYDMRHTIIPDPWVYAFNALAFITAFLVRPQESWSLLVFAGPVAALPLFALWAASKGRWMGFGDVKLALGIGWLLGFPYGIISVLFAFVIGAVVSVGILMPLPKVMHALGITQLERTAPALTMKSEVPFGPFLIASCLIIWFSLLYHVPVPIFSGI